MQESENIQCPFCGQTFALEVDATQTRQQLIVDCEVCCRPLEIAIHCEGGEIVDCDVRGE
jgi:hypothetical protein